MKTFATLATLATFIVSVVLAHADTVSYDRTYDNANGQLLVTSCSDGPNGLIQYGYNKYSDLPDFPYIGGAAVIVGWDSPDCGICWTLEHDGRTITVLAVDHASDGFNISLDALNDLTNGQGKLLGRVEGVVATQVDRAQCGVNF